MRRFNSFEESDSRGGNVQIYLFLVDTGIGRHTLVFFIGVQLA